MKLHRVKQVPAPVFVLFHLKKVLLDLGSCKEPFFAMQSIPKNSRSNVALKHALSIIENGVADAISNSLVDDQVSQLRLSVIYTMQVSGRVGKS